jgi:hypothetical protein
MFVREPDRVPTAAWIRSLTTPAATSSTSTRTDRDAAVMPITCQTKTGIGPCRRLVTAGARRRPRRTSIQAMAPNDHAGQGRRARRVEVHRWRRRRPGGPARRRQRQRSGAVHADDQRRRKRHGGQVGAQRRWRQLAAVDGRDLHPDAVTRDGRLLRGAPLQPGDSTGSAIGGREVPRPAAALLRHVSADAEPRATETRPQVASPPRTPSIHRATPLAGAVHT